EPRAHEASQGARGGGDPGMGRRPGGPPRGPPGRRARARDAGLRPEGGGRRQAPGSRPRQRAAERAPRELIGGRRNHAAGLLPPSPPVGGGGGAGGGGGGLPKVSTAVPPVPKDLVTATVR